MNPTSCSRLPEKRLPEISGSLCLLTSNSSAVCPAGAVCAVAQGDALLGEQVADAVGFGPVFIGTGLLAPGDEGFDFFVAQTVCGRAALQEFGGVALQQPDGAGKGFEAAGKLGRLGFIGFACQLKQYGHGLHGVEIVVHGGEEAAGVAVGFGGYLKLCWRHVGQRVGWVSRRRNPTNQMMECWVCQPNLHAKNAASPKLKLYIRCLINERK